MGKKEDLGLLRVQTIELVLMMLISHSDTISSLASSPR